MNAARLDGTGRWNALYRFLRALRMGHMFPSVARHHHQEGQAERHHLPGVRQARTGDWYKRRYCCCALLLWLGWASVQAQTFADRVPAANQTYSDLYIAYQQSQALLAIAQGQNTTDAATILTLRNQVAALQAQLASIPACAPCAAACPAGTTVTCVAPLPPPVVTPPPPLPVGTATLSWSAVVGASGYRAYYGTAPGVYAQALGQGIQVLAPPFTVTGLAATRYYFAVTATTATAESGFSNEVFKDIGTVIQPPPPPPPPPPPVPGPIANCAKLDIKSPLGAALVDAGGATWTVVPSTAADRVANQVEARMNGVPSGKGSTNFIQLIGGTIFSFDPPSPAGSGPGWERCCWASVAAQTCP